MTQEAPRPLAGRDTASADGSMGACSELLQKNAPAAPTLLSARTSRCRRRPRCSAPRARLAVVPPSARCSRPTARAEFHARVAQRSGTTASTPTVPLRCDQRKSPPHRDLPRGVSEGTRTPDRLDHNEMPPPYTFGCAPCGQLPFSVCPGSSAFRQTRRSATGSRRSEDSARRSRTCSSCSRRA